jgi:hypothetical protein
MYSVYDEAGFSYFVDRIPFLWYSEFGAFHMIIVHRLHLNSQQYETVFD